MTPEAAVVQGEPRAPHEFSQEEKRYLIASGTAIIDVLRDLRYRASQVTAYAEGGQFILTSIVDVDGGRGEFAFEASPREAQASKFLESRRIVFTANVEGIRIKFTTVGVPRPDHRGHPALVSDLPSTLMRLQRREYYRLPMPSARPVKCTIPFVRGEHKGWLELMVVDLSCGGIALLSSPEEFVPERGVRYPCTVDFPGIGKFQATLELRSSAQFTTARGQKRLKSGYEFVAFAGSAQSMIQRYIMTMQGGRRTRT